MVYRSLVSALCLFVLSCSDPVSITRALLTGGPWAEIVIRAGDAAHDGSDGIHLVDFEPGTDRPRSACTVWEDSDTMSCHANAGMGYDWPEVVGASGLDSAEGVMSCQLDGDVWPDLIAFGEAAGVHIFPTRVGPTHGGQLPLTIPSDRWLGGVCDGDGNIVAFGETSRVYLFVNPGDSNVWNAAAWVREYAYEAKHVMSIHLVDLMGGGRLDSIVSERVGIDGVTPGPGAWWADGDTGDGDSIPQTSHPISIGRRAMIATMADMSLPPDGIPDLVQPYMRGSGYTTSYLEICERILEMPFFAPCVSVPLPYPLNQTTVDLKSVAVADFDLNGLPDIAVGSTPVTGHLVWILLQTSPGVWELLHVDPVSWGAKIDNLEVEDVDGDGDPDLLVSEEQRVVNGFAYGQGLVVFVNPAIN